MKHFLLSTTFFLACLITSAQANLNRGLVAWYPFNGNANDVSGNGLNGFVQNGASLTSDKNGTPNSAYLFDGIDDYIDIPDNPKLRFRDSFSVCISFMKLSQPGGNLIEKRALNSGTNSSFDIAAGSSGANGAVKTGDNCSNAGSGWHYTSFTQPLALNQWYCLVMTFNAGTLNFYQDGVLISSTNTGSTRVDSCAGSNIRIGYHLSFDPIWLHGKVDDVRLYNRALTQEEVSSLCSTTSVTTCNDNWLKMPNALSGVTIGDLDITGNQVTIEAICNATGDTTRALVSKHTSPSNVNYFLCPDLAQITTSNGFFSITSSCPFENNKTYHVALVYNGSSLKLYRNGFLLGEVPASGNLVTNNLPTTIGEQAYAMDNGFGNISNIFKGVINEVRIWNVARSQSDIRTYMNSSLPSPTTQTGLQAYYIFDDLTNKQGNTAFNGTLRGAATIANANPDCVFSADSCLAAPVSCNTWLNMPAKLTGVSIGELDITGNQVTVEAMCTATDIYDLSRALVSKHGWSANCNYFLCPDLAQITTSNGFFSATSPCSFVSNKTYHVAMVYNGSSLRLYRNGFLMQEVPASGNLVTNNWPATIGEYAYAVANNNASISNIFKGYINEVRIWNVARTQQQIRDFMNIELPSPATQTGLLAYYNFDNLTNKQGNTAYNATLLGASTINATNSTCSFTADSCLTVVPVTLISFTSRASNEKNIILNWTTVQEYGISKYQVQRSLYADRGFETIGSVNAAATGNSNSYSFVDRTVKLNTRYFYRLLILEASGTSRYSPTRDQLITAGGTYTSVYPNPTTGTVTVSVKNYDGVAYLHLINNQGQSILSKTTLVNGSSSGIVLQMGNLPRGTYYLQLLTGNERITKKIIKQ